MPDEETPVMFDDVEDASSADAGPERRLPRGVRSASADQDRPSAQELDQREARMSGPRKPMGPDDDDRPLLDDGVEPTEPEQP